MPRYIEMDHGKQGTVKNCPAVEDAAYSGYMIYLPSDVFIDTTKEYPIVEFKNFGLNEEEFKNSFVYEDVELTLMKGYGALEDFVPFPFRWQSFWGVKTDDGYSSMFVHPFHRTDLPYTVATAIVDTDRFTTRLPYSFFIKKGFCGEVKKGTPMMQVIPFKREEWHSKIIDAPSQQQIEEEYGPVIRRETTNVYKKFYWKRKKYR